MVTSPIPLVKQVGRVPSMTVPLDAEQERKFQRLMEETIMIDLHQHPMVMPEDLGDLPRLGQPTSTEAC